MPEDITLERVRKLLAKAEDPGITPQEAEAYNSKAAELIAKYGIERAKLESVDPKRRESVIDKVIKLQRPYVINKITLLHLVAIAMRCKVIRLKNDAAHIIGYESDIERVETVFSSLLVQQALGLNLATATKPLYEDPRTFSKGYFAGFQSAVYNRLSAAEKRAAAESQSTEPGTALVLVDRTAVVERRTSEIYPKLRMTAGSRANSNAGYSSGHSDGTRANLGTTNLGRGMKGSIGR